MRLLAVAHRGRATYHRSSFCARMRMGVRMCVRTGIRISQRIKAKNPCVRRDQKTCAGGTCLVECGRGKVLREGVLQAARATPIEMALPFGETPGARDPRALAILAKTIYRELRSSGFEARDVMTLAGELLSQVTSDVKSERGR